MEEQDRVAVVSLILVNLHWNASAVTRKLCPFVTKPCKSTTVSDMAYQLVTGLKRSLHHLKFKGIDSSTVFLFDLFQTCRIVFVQSNVHQKFNKNQEKLF